jgi:hypothetical protein
MVLRSWQSLPEISKLELGKEFFRFLGNPTHRGRLYSSSVISFELEKKKFSIRGMSKKKLNNFFLKHNIDFDFNDIDIVFDAAIYLRPILSLVVPKFYNNAKYAKKAVGLSTKYYKYLSPDLKADKEICKLAMRSKNGCMVKYMPKEIVSNPRFAKQCITKHVDAIRFIPKEILEKKVIKKAIKNNLHKFNCRASLDCISDDYFLIAIFYNRKLFNMARFLKNKDKTSEGLLRYLSICNAITPYGRIDQSKVPSVSFPDRKNILCSAILRDVDKFFLNKNYPICLRSLIFIYACLDWDGNITDCKKMYKLTTCAIAENIAISTDNLPLGTRKRRKVSNLFQDLANRIKDSYNPFLLANYPNLKANEEINKISKHVMTHLHKNNGSFIFKFNDYNGEPLTSELKLHSTLMESSLDDIPF